MGEGRHASTQVSSGTECQSEFQPIGGATDPAEQGHHRLSRAFRTCAPLCRASGHDVEQAVGSQ